MSAVISYLRDVRSAAAFLTTLPVVPPPRAGADEARRAVRAYPAVGLLVGLALLLLGGLLDGAGVLRPALLVAAWALLTGGLHFDGWCDLADAALAPKGREARWRIAKQPHVGSFALLAGGALLLVRFAALLEGPWWAVLPAAILARGLVPWVMARYPLAPGSVLGRGAAASGGAARVSVAGALLLTAALAGVLLVTGSAALATGVGLAACVLTLLAWQGMLAGFLLRRMGGLNGDAYGALIESGEVVVLMVLALAATP